MSASALVALNIARAVGRFLVTNWLPLLVIAVLGFATWKYTSVISENEDLRARNAALAGELAGMKEDAQQLSDVLELQKDGADKIQDVQNQIDDRFSQLDRDLRKQRAAGRDQVEQVKKGGAPASEKDMLDFMVRNSSKLRGDTP